jgi:hypothetical protein
LLPVVNRLAHAFAAASGIDLAAATDAVLANTQKPETKAAGATATGPDTTDARGPGGVNISPVPAVDPAATGLAVGLEGVTTFYQGTGLRVAMPPRFMREMARRLEAVADELEGKPRANVTPSWGLVGEVVGNA